MLFAVLASASLLYSQWSWAFPQQTAFTNATRTSSISQTTPTCSPSCILGVPERFQGRYYAWFPGSVVTTLTAATVVLVVNNRTNATRTTTVLNTELAGFSLPETNSAGTKVTTVIQSDYLAKTNATTVMTYPTTYYDYSYSFFWSGVLPSTTSGHSTCITNSGTAELLPSHPAWDGTYYDRDTNQTTPAPPNNMADYDKTGLTYSLTALDEGCAEWLLEEFFANVGAVSMCSTDTRACNAPAHALETAQFLTVTSTSHDAVDAVQITSSLSSAAQSSSPQSESAVLSSSAPILPPTVATSQTSQPQPILTPSPLQSGISPLPLPVLSQEGASPPAPSLASPAPLSTTVSPTSLPLFSSAAAISSLAQSTQPVTAPSTDVGITVVKAPTETSGTTTGLPAIAVGSQTNLVDSDIAVTTITSRDSTNLVAGTTTLPNSSPGAVAVPPPIVVGSNTVAADSASQYIVSGATLLPGSTITIGTGTLATVIALQTSNSETQIIIGTTTSLLAKPSTIEPSTGPPPLTIGTQTITANSQSQYIVNGQTLAPGSPVAVGIGSSATVVALQTSNSQTELIIGTSTSIIVPSTTPPLTSILVPGPITIGTQTLTPDSSSQYLIAGQTLVPGGPAITVSGTPVSLAPSATAIMVGTSTSGLGGYIWSGIGGGSATTTTSGPAMYTGGAEAMVSGKAWGLGLGVFCGVLAML